jgi:uncharacterized protein YndB with AHSA1/START domain
MSALALDHRLDRTLHIHATPETVFSFFTDTDRWARWWGGGSSIEPKVGGGVVIRYPDGTEVTGSVVELTAPTKLVFTYGYASGNPVPPGGSLVTIALKPSATGTRLLLTHEFAEADVRDKHMQGWRYQLSLFANLVSDEVNAGATELVDAWFDLWAETDGTKRSSMIERIASDEITFHDRYGCTDGAGDLLPHIEAAQFYMPGFRMRRTGDVRHCQGTVLADWSVAGPDGVDRARGVNVFVLGASGRLESVTGFTVPSSPARPEPTS